MKKFGNNLLKILVISFIVTLAGCEKFKLLKDADMDNVSAGSNTQNITFTEFLKSYNYQQDDRYSILKQYAQAVKKAGLESLLDEADRNFTIVAFTDAAMNSFLTTNGYASIDDVPGEVLKHLILNNIIEDGKFQVVDFADNKDVGFKSLTGDSIFFKKEPSLSNPYVLTINSTSRFASPSVSVRSRDLPYKNAIVHVVNSYTYTAITKVNADEVPGDLPVDKDSVFVTKDVVLQFASNEAGYLVHNPTTDDFQSKLASSVNNSGTRRIYLQFPVRQPTFSKRLGNVTLKTYCTKITNGTNVATNTINVYKDADTNWEENPLPAYQQLPVRGEQVLSSFEIITSGGPGKWYSANITNAFKQSLDDSQTFINVGVWNYSSPNIFFGHRGYQSGKYKSYLLFESAPQVLITNVATTPVNVSATEFYKVITKSNLNATGTSDKNVDYIIVQMPQKGTLLCNGKPLGKGGVFTQHQLTQGVVKYLNNDEAGTTTDEIKLEVKDYRGGYYPDIITLSVQIN